MQQIKKEKKSGITEKVTEKIGITFCCCFYDTNIQCLFQIRFDKYCQLFIYIHSKKKEQTLLRAMVIGKVNGISKLYSNSNWSCLHFISH